MQAIRSMPVGERSVVEQQPSPALFPYIGIEFANGNKRRHSDDEQESMFSSLTGRAVKSRSHRRVRPRIRSPSPSGRSVSYTLALWPEDMTHIQDRAVVDQSFLTENEWPGPPDGAAYGDDNASESVLGSDLSDVDSDVGRSRALSRTPMPSSPSSRCHRATPDVAVVETDLEPSDLSESDSAPPTPTPTKLMLGSHEIGPRRIVSDEYEADDEEESASEAEAAVVRSPTRANRGRSAPIGLGPAPVRRGGIKRSSCPPNLAIVAEAPIDDLVRELSDLRTASLGSTAGGDSAVQDVTNAPPERDSHSAPPRQYMRSKVDDYRRRMVLFGRMPRREVPVRPFRPSSPRRRSSARTSTREDDVRMVSGSDTAGSAMDVDDDASLASVGSSGTQVPVAVRLEGRSAFDLRPKHASRSRVERQRTLNSRKLHRTSPTSLLPLREHHRGSWAAPEPSSFHSIRQRAAARKARRDAAALHNACSMNGRWTQVVGNWVGIEDVWRAQKNSGWWFNQAQHPAASGSAEREIPSESGEPSYRPEPAPSDIVLTEDENSSEDESEEDGLNVNRVAGFGLDVSVDDEEEDDLSFDDFDEDAQPLSAEWYEVDGISPEPVAPASPSLTVISISSDDTEASIASEALSEASSTWSAPPTYDRVVRSASPLPLIAPIAIRAAQSRASVPPRPSTPPGYHPAMYSRRSPSPPPPYNAQPANERVEVAVPTSLPRPPQLPRRGFPTGSVDLGALALAAAQRDRSHREYTPMHIWVGDDNDDDLVGGDAFDEYVEPPIVGAFPTEQYAVPEPDYSHLYDRYDRSTSVASAFDLGPDLEEGEEWEGVLDGDAGEQESATATAPVARLWSALTGWFSGRQ